ncbi:MAG: hypothetical protein WDM90_08640 [Ferruginibacter sp.]
MCCVWKNPVVKVVKAYEQCLEEDAENIEKLTNLMALRRRTQCLEF